ncbi:MAG: hypothetical protein IPL53_12260 [Ignavibacteria bacterium]|nr:hypothetical protein [Ignavibacteria bacterium]
MIKNNKHASITTFGIGLVLKKVFTASLFESLIIKLTATAKKIVMITR